MRIRFSESRTRLEIIERIASDGEYTFIYVSAVMAYVVPHDAVSEGGPEAFSEAIKERIGPR